MGNAEKDEGNGLKNLDKGKALALPLFHVKHYGDVWGTTIPTYVTPTPKGGF